MGTTEPAGAKYGTKGNFFSPHQFYNVNKLKINDDKTQMLISCKNKLRKFTKNIFFMALNYKIEQKQAIKILGMYIQSNLQLDTQINKLV